MMLDASCYVQSLEGFLVKFEDLREDVPVEYDGVPSRNGSQRMSPGTRKEKKKEIKETIVSVDHEYTGERKKRRLIQDTKKVGCTAKVKLRMLLRFPTFKINGPDSKKSRKEVTERLRKASLSSEEKKYQVIVKYCGQHHDHITGKEAGYGLPLDPTVIKKIRHLVQEDGVVEVADIQTHIRMMVKDLAECDPSSRSFNPTPQDIRFHMHQALNENRYSSDDQKNLIELIDSWREKYPDDSFFFQPASTDEDGVTDSLRFVHMTALQKRLLVKYEQQVVLMDSTYRTMKYNFPLYFISVMTNSGYMVVASFIVGTDNAKEISSSLKVIRECNVSWNGIRGHSCAIWT